MRTTHGLYLLYKHLPENIVSVLDFVTIALRLDVGRIKWQDIFIIKMISFVSSFIFREGVVFNVTIVMSSLSDSLRSCAVETK
jgi:hypothetical protein